MKKINLLLTITGLVVVFFSCRKDTLTEVHTKHQKTGNLSWISLLGESNDGHFKINSSTTYASQNISRTAEIFGRIKGENSSLNVGNVEFGNAVIVPNSNNIYRTAYDFDFTLNYGEIVWLKYQNEKTSFYLPKLINYTEHDWANNNTIYPNFELNWNEDAQNSTDVVITMTYNPAFNTSLSQQGYNQVIENDILTDDTGSYTFSANDLTIFPDGAKVRIIIRRGTASAFNTTTNKKIHIYGVTSNTVDAVIDLN